MFSLAFLFLLTASLPGGLGLGLGPSVSSLDPVEDGYRSRFLTSGVSYGLAVTLDSPGPLVFHLGGEYFSKNSSTGWDGEVSALLMWAFPSGRISLMEGLNLFAGPGIVGITGEYSGTDDFGSYVEADGSSVGFALSAGADIDLWGPLYGRLAYRRGWIDIRNDRVMRNGQESVVYPAAETDLGYSQYSFTLNVRLVPVDEPGI
jgi:opacity protein-like surface antigen